MLRLNPGAWGELLTSQLSWVAAWLLVTRVCPVYLVKNVAILEVSTSCWEVSRERWESSELGRWAVRLPMNNAAMETGMHVGRYLVYAGLDCEIMSQDGRNAFPWHGLLNYWVHKMRRCCDWGEWNVRKLEPIARLNIRRPNMVKRGLMYLKQNWKWMLTRLWKNETIGLYVGYSKESNPGFRGGRSRSQP